MIDELIAEIERARQVGAVVVLKWDGERTSDIGTVIVSHQASNFTFRRDTDDIFTGLSEGLAEFWATKRAAG